MSHTPTSPLGQLCTSPLLCFEVPYAISYELKVPYYIDGIEKVKP